MLRTKKGDSGVSYRLGVVILLGVVLHFFAGMTMGIPRLSIGHRFIKKVTKKKKEQGKNFFLFFLTYYLIAQAESLIGTLHYMFPKSHRVDEFMMMMTSAIDYLQDRQSFIYEYSIHVDSIVTFTVPLFA